MTKYAVINEWQNDDDSGARVEYLVDTLSEALVLVANEISFTVTDRHHVWCNDPDRWERYDIIMVEDEDEADELLESGDYYEVDPLFHWDTSMIDGE